MTEIATTDWFGRWGTAVFSENTAIFDHFCAGVGWGRVSNKHCLLSFSRLFYGIVISLVYIKFFYVAG